MVQDKYLDGNILIAQKMGLPNLLQQSLILSNSQIELAKKCVLYLLHPIGQYRQKNATSNNVNSNNPVWIPYAQMLAEILPAEKGIDNRITKRILSFLSIISLARAHLRPRLQYGAESLIIADINEDLHKVLHITQNLGGVPQYKQKIFKEVILEKYKSKTNPDESPDGTKEERIIAVTTKELCDYYKEKTAKTITTNNMKQNYLNEFINNGLLDEEDSIIDKRQKIYYPVIDIPESEKFDSPDCKESTEKIDKLSNLDRMDNILQHPKLLLPKNCRNIPENWLELEIFELLKCPLKVDKFELYDKDNERSKLVRIPPNPGQRFCDIIRRII